MPYSATAFIAGPVLFETWPIHATSNALSHVETPEEFLPFIARHVAGDWGDLDNADKEANAQALAHGERIFSSYKFAIDDETIWIITEWDRSLTTILLPEDY